ncbi:MAG: pseudouridine synthase [Acidobacteria bacterium]|nr:pseudouridine synthase [Acidobacteriota bacterium]MCZ6650951.1 pseudouridine synthase [Acidobacteriota bacterium]MCZ6833356.1 pseudouridine synthase [Acidobacteriota bacterium]
MTSQSTGQRIQKVLSHAGVASRREGERLLQAGRIRVNGTVVTELGLRVSPADRIEVDGQPVARGRRPLYVLMYKPRGCVTTLSDPQGRTTVADFLPDSDVQLFPVGRLDYDSEGLLLFTNDGELAHSLMRPETHVPKTYLVKVRGQVDARALARLRRPFHIEGRHTLPAQAEVQHRNRHTVLRIILMEGRRHQIREMCRRIDHPVLRLRRVSYGPLKDPGLRPGQTRHLSREEVLLLKDATGSGREGERP